MTDAPEHGWLIHKAGRGWYRPYAKGYTMNASEAGRYSHKDALAYSHPNGLDGPRDGLTIKHESELPPAPEDDALQQAFAAGIEAAKKAIADLPWGRTEAVDEGHEQAFRAVEALTPSAPAPVAPKVKPLVWEYHPAGKLAPNNMGGSYIIDTRGPRPKWLKWPGGHGPDLETVEEMQAAAQADHETRILSQIDMAPVTVQEAGGFDALIRDAKGEAERAMVKFPQPNYVISKVAEEAGEVVKAAIHCAEGRESASEVRAEMKQLIAMLYRLWVEGDEVHGLRALAEQEGE